MATEVHSSLTIPAGDIPAQGTNRTIERTTVALPAAMGAGLGLAWGVGLRAWMALLAIEFGDQPKFTWPGTFGAILLPAALMGALQGWAAYAARSSESKRWRWAILSPLLLITGPLLFLEGFITGLITTGLGGGAIAVALIGLVGGYAFSEFGPVWLRRISGLVAGLFTFLTVYFLYYKDTGAFVPANAGPSRAFGSLLFVMLMALLMAGISAPSRSASRK